MNYKEQTDRYYNKLDIIRIFITINDIKVKSNISINLHIDSIVINKLIDAKAIIINENGFYKWNIKIPNSKTLAATVCDNVTAHYNSLDSRKERKTYKQPKKKKVNIFRRIWIAIWNEGL
jgi:hypothetical protein